MSGSGINPGLKIEPSQWEFPNQRIGTTSAPKTIVVSNTGSGTLRVTSVQITGDSTFSVTPNTPFELVGGSGQTRELNVTFQPVLDNVRSVAELELKTADPEIGTRKVSLSGRGVQPRLVVSPDPLDFSSQNVGSTSAPIMVRITNEGTGPVTLTNVATSPSGSFNVSLSAAKELIPNTANASVELPVTFSPKSLGALSSNFQIATDATPALTKYATFQGRGISRLTLTTPQTLDFQAVEVNKELLKPVRIQNDSTLDVNVDIGALNAPFALRGVTAGTVKILANGGSQSFNVAFNPTSKTSFNQTLTITGNANTSPTEFRISLQGEGAVAEGAFSLPTSSESLVSLDFGGSALNTPKLRRIRLKNTGKVALSAEAPRYSDGNSSVFSGPNTPIVVQPESYSDFDLSFTPNNKNTELYSGTFKIKTNSATHTGGEMVLNLRGVLARPSIAISHSAISFPKTRVGTESAATVLSITNTGNSDVSISGLPIIGQFTATPQGVTSLPVTLGTSPETQVLKVNVTFKPTLKGDAKDALLTVVSNATQSGEPSPTVALFGRGTVSSVDVNKTTLAFGNQKVGRTSDPQSFVISNPGEADLEISSFVLPSTFAFSHADGGTALPISVTGGGSVPILVTFTPKEEGTVGSGSAINIISNAASSAQEPVPVVNLTGNGTDGRLKLISPNSIAFTDVPVSQSRQQTIQLKNEGQARLVINSVESPDGGPFTISGLNSGTPVDPNGTVNFTVAFRPTGRGTVVNSSIIVSDSSLHDRFPLPMEGTGVAPVVSVTPTDELYFNPTNVGASRLQGVTVRNEGETPLYVSGVTFVDVRSPDGGTLDGGGLGSGERADFSVDSVVVTDPTDGGSGSGGGALMVLNKQQSGTINLKFAPRAQGTRQAKAILQTNDRNVELKVSGEGTSPLLNVTLTGDTSFRNIVDFKNVFVGSTSLVRELVFTNQGDGELTLEEAVVAGADADAFGVVLAQKPPIKLARGRSTKILVSFKPSAIRQSYNGVLRAKFEEPSVEYTPVTLKGSGVGRTVQLSKSTLEFGKQLTRTTSAERSFTLTNTSDTKVSLRKLEFSGSCNSQFGYGTLNLPIELAAAASSEPTDGGVTTRGDQERTIGVSFNPLAAGAVNDCKLVLSFEGLDPVEVTMHGEGIDSVLQISPPSLDFGGVRVGSVSKRQVTLNNLSDDPIEFSSLSLTGTGQSFTHDGDALRTLTKGQPAILTLTYAPLAESFSTSTLTFGTRKPALVSAATLALSGTATRRILRSDQAELDFGRVDVNKSSEHKVITITNTSADTKRVTAKLVSLEGLFFILDDSALRDPLPGGKSATVTVHFAPKQAGVRDGQVEIALEGDSSAELSITLKGTGRDLLGEGGGCSTTGAGGGGLLLMLALLGQRVRRKRR